MGEFEKQQKKDVGVGKKIFIALGIIILVAIIFIGFSAYQAYSVFKAISDKSTPHSNLSGNSTQSNSSKIDSDSLEEDLQSFVDNDCSKFENIKADVELLESKILPACKNPLLRSTVNFVVNVPIDCHQIEEWCPAIKANYTQFEKNCSPNSS